MQGRVSDRHQNWTMQYENKNNLESVLHSLIKYGSKEIRTYCMYVDDLDISILPRKLPNYEYTIRFVKFRTTEVRSRDLVKVLNFTKLLVITIILLFFIVFATPVIAWPQLEYIVNWVYRMLT